MCLFYIRRYMSQMLLRAFYIVCKVNSHVDNVCRVRKHIASALVSQLDVRDMRMIALSLGFLRYQFLHRAPRAFSRSNTVFYFR